MENSTNDMETAVVSIDQEMLEAERSRATTEREANERTVKAWEEYMAAVENELNLADDGSAMSMLGQGAIFKAHSTRLSDAEKVVNAKFKAIEPTIVEIMINSNTSKYTKGGRTIYLKRTLWAGHKDGSKLELIDAIKNGGEDWEGFVAMNYNAQSLSARVREFDPEKIMTEEQVIERLPEAIRPYIKVTIKTEIGNTKA